MKKFTKIFAMMLVVMMVAGMFSTVSFAAGSTFDFTTISTDGGTAAGSINTKVTELGGSVVSIIVTVARVVAVGMVAVFAVKWMMATPQKKQELKERLIYLAIGVVLLFAGPAILNIIATFGSSISA